MTVTTHAPPLHNIDDLYAVVVDQGKALKALEGLPTAVRALEKKVDGHGQILADHGQLLRRIDGRLDRIDGRLDRIESALAEE